MLEGKVALVTGAGKGIGKAIALIFAQHGAHVAVNAYHEDTTQATCLEIRNLGRDALAIPGDVADYGLMQQQISGALEHFGHIDILVNNAAAPAAMIPFRDTTPQDRDNEMVTLRGCFNCTRLVLDSMIAQRYGRIINISSVDARFGEPGRVVYSAAKAGMDVFSRGLAKEVGEYNITVNSVSPGATESPRFKARSKKIREEHLRKIPLGRFCEPEEVAGLVLFLASEKGAYISGAVLPIDGCLTE